MIGQKSIINSCCNCK